MKRGEGLQPISPAPQDRIYEDLVEADPESLAQLHAGLSGLTQAFAGEVVGDADVPAPSPANLSPWNHLARAGLQTLISVEKRAAELIGIDTTGL